MVVFVGNFSPDTSEQDLLDKFEQYGRVAAVNMMRDEISERVLGFGFVEMPDGGAAQRAIAGLNHSMLGGATIMVCETGPRTERRRLLPKRVSSAPVHMVEQG